MFTIYKHTTPNGKVYIGQTNQPTHRRWRNGEGYARNAYFYRAIQKYGWDSIRHEVICTCETQEEATATEAHYIRVYNSLDPANGYNLVEATDSGRTLSEETRQRMSNARKGKFAGENNPNFGRKHTEEERKRMSEQLVGKYRGLFSHRYGAVASEETRAKQSASRKASPAAQSHMAKMNAAKSKRVLCKETGAVYASAREAARETGFSQGNISSVCRGVYKQAYGYHWEYI